MRHSVPRLYGVNAVQFKLEFTNEPMDAAIAGLMGGLVGAGASLLGLVIQQHYQTKRERVKVGADLALSEYQRDLELAKPLAEATWLL